MHVQLTQEFVQFVILDIIWFRINKAVHNVYQTVPLVLMELPAPLVIMDTSSSQILLTHALVAFKIAHYALIMFHVLLEDVSLPITIQMVVALAVEQNVYDV